MERVSFAACGETSDVKLMPTKRSGRPGRGRGSKAMPTRRLGAPAGAQRSGSGGERRRNGVSAFSPIGGNKRYAVCADEAGTLLYINGVLRGRSP